VSKPNAQQMTPYMMAAEKGHTDIVNALINIPGVDINAKNSNGNPYLYPNPNYYDANISTTISGKTAIQLAVAGNHFDTFKALVVLPGTIIIIIIIIIITIIITIIIIRH